MWFHSPDLAIVNILFTPLCVFFFFFLSCVQAACEILFPLPGI